MKKYKVVLEGRNFILKSDKGPTKMGFYTTRFVEATSPEEAENLSIELIRKDSDLKNVILNERSDPPTIILDSIEELSIFGDNSVPGTGYTFYPEEEE